MSPKEYLYLAWYRIWRFWEETMVKQFPNLEFQNTKLCIPQFSVIREFGKNDKRNVNFNIYFIFKWKFHINSLKLFFPKAQNLLILFEVLKFQKRGLFRIEDRKTEKREKTRKVGTSRGRSMGHAILNFHSLLSPLKLTIDNGLSNWKWFYWFT